MKNRKSRAFTLIELLMVVTIIGILAALIMVSIVGAQNKAKDTQRKSRARSAATALEQYYLDNKTYFFDAQTTVANGEVINTGSTLATALVNGKFLASTAAFDSGTIDARYITNSTGRSYAQAWLLSTNADTLATSGYGVYQTNSSIGSAGGVTAPGSVSNGFHADGTVGTANFVTVGNYSGVVEWTNNDWSISVWANLDSIGTTNKGIVSDRIGPVAASTTNWFTFGVVWSATPALINLCLEYNPGNTVCSSPAFNPSGLGWQHYVVTKKTTGGTYVIKIYRNGDPTPVVTSAALNANIGGSSTTNNFSIGRWYSGASQLWNGGIDDVRVYNSELMPAQIALIYNGGQGTYVNSSEPNLVSAWALDEHTAPLASATTPDIKGLKPGSLTSYAASPIMLGKVPLGLTLTGAVATSKAFLTYGYQTN